MTTAQQQRAREVRRELGVSRESFAELLDVSVRAVSSWELEGPFSRNPSKSALKLMDQLLEYEKLLQVLNRPLPGRERP